MHFPIGTEREKLLQSLLDKYIVSYDEQQDIWNIYRYKDVKRILTDPVTFTSEGTNTTNHPITCSLPATDGEQHRKLRLLVTKNFSPKESQQWEPRIRAIVNELLDTAIARGRHMDLMWDFAEPLPTLLMTEIMGYPAEDYRQLKRWGDEQMVTWADPQLPLPDEVIAYFDRIIQERRIERRHDLISQLLDEEIDGRSLTRDELLGFLFLFLVAPIEAIPLTIGFTLMLLLEHPEALTLARTNFSVLPELIEEVLRIYSPQSRLYRRPTTDVTIGDQLIPKGSLIALWVSTSNRDGELFTNPHSFDPTRETNPHLAWGYGPHFCLGNSLAILELKLALEILLTRFKSIQLDPESPPKFSVRGELKSMPILFTI